MKILMPLFVTAFLCGCSSQALISEQVLDSEAPIEGLSYSLPRGLIPISIKYSNSTLTFIPPTSAKYFPDPQARYKLNIKNSGFANDDYTLGTNSDGLLQSVNVTNKDSSVEIVGQVIQLVNNIALASAGGQHASKEASTPTPNFEINTVLDPFGSGSEIAKLNRDYPGLKISIDGVEKRELRNSASKIAATAASCNSSVCFRILRPVTVTIDFNIDNNRLHSKFIQLVPDPFMIAEYDVRRSACVERKNNLTFTNGVLTNVVSTKPSEVLGCLKIPVDIAKALVDIPAGLLSVKVKNVQTETALTDAQTLNLKAQTNFLIAQSTWLAAQSKVTTPTP